MRVKGKVAQLCLTLCDPLDYIVHKAPLSMEFSGQEYWSELPFPSPGNLPNPGIEPASLMSSALAGGFSSTSTTWEDFLYVITLKSRLSFHQLQN